MAKVVAGDVTLGLTCCDVILSNMARSVEIVVKKLSVRKPIDYTPWQHLLRDDMDIYTVDKRQRHHIATPCLTRVLTESSE